MERKVCVVVVGVCDSMKEGCPTMEAEVRHVATPPPKKSTLRQRRLCNNVQERSCGGGVVPDYTLLLYEHRLHDAHEAVIEAPFILKSDNWIPSY